MTRSSIQKSTTTVIAADDLLYVGRKGKSAKIDFRCVSDNPGTSELWNDVKDCKWSENGGLAGHLQGTISDQSGGNHSFEFTYAEGIPNRIHLEIAAMPVSGGDLVTMGGGGGGAGSANGNDDPP